MFQELHKLLKEIQDLDNALEKSAIKSHAGYEDVEVGLEPLPSVEDELMERVQLFCIKLKMYLDNIPDTRETHRHRTDLSIALRSLAETRNKTFVLIQILKVKSALVNLINFHDPSLKLKLEACQRTGLRKMPLDLMTMTSEQINELSINEDIKECLTNALNEGAEIWHMGDDYYMLYDPYFDTNPVLLRKLAYNSDLGLHIKS